MPTSSENNVNDIVIGDENGDVSLISNNQVFLKHNFGSPITNIEITKDMSKYIYIDFYYYQYIKIYICVKKK